MNLHAALKLAIIFIPISFMHLAWVDLSHCSLQPAPLTQPSLPNFTSLNLSHFPTATVNI